MMINKSDEIENYFNLILPDAKCALNYEKDYEFLIAVMLSAQTTDNAVNKVTSILFTKYNTLEKLNNASFAEIFEIIKGLGLAKTKANNIKNITKDLLNNYSGKVPNNKKDLIMLSGVGNKTANVVLIELFKDPQFPVDTHVARIAKRLSIAKQNDDVSTVEEKLKKYFKKEKWIKLHHQFIWFGRTVCSARNPKCSSCKLNEFCAYFVKESKASK